MCNQNSCTLEPLDWTLCAHGCTLTKHGTTKLAEKSSSLNVEVLVSLLLCDSKLNIFRLWTQIGHKR